jgi:hypothetical protein
MSWAAILQKRQSGMESTGMRLILACAQDGLHEVVASDTVAKTEEQTQIPCGNDKYPEF